MTRFVVNTLIVIGLAAAPLYADPPATRKQTPAKTAEAKAKPPAACQAKVLNAQQKTCLASASGAQAQAACCTAG